MAKKKFALKKVLAGFVSAAVLASSLFAGNVFAVDGAAAEQTAKQITPAGQPTVSQSYADGKVSIEKTVAATGTENLFDVTVKVSTTETITEVTTSPDAAVVLVMDVSNSMDGNSITSAKKAAQDFVKDYTTDTGSAKRMISIVEFGSNAMTVMDWTDAVAKKDSVNSAIANTVKIGYTYSKTGCTYDGCTNADSSHTHSVRSTKSDWVKIQDKVQWESGKLGDGHLGGYWLHKYQCSVCDKECIAEDKEHCERHTHEKSFWTSYDNVKDSGGTNIEGGLRLADNLLADDAIADIDNAYVILLTDGLPTFYVSDADTTTSTEFMNGTKGCGNAHDGTYCNVQNDYKDIPSIADSIKEEAKLYAIGFNLSGKVDGKDVRTWLTGTVGVDQYFAASTTDLSNYFKNISQIIKNAAKAWILTDPMGSNIDFVEGTSDNFSGTVATETNDVITWNLKDDATFTKTENATTGKTTYTYTMTYQVKLDNTTAAFAADEDGIVPTNGNIQLTYMLTKADGSMDPTLHTAAFDKSPLVKGYLADLTFTKTDGTNPLPGATFTLNGKTATSDANGTVSFTDIPSGASYTLTENGMKGYLPLDPVTVKVAYGVATDANGERIIAIANTPEVKNIIVVHDYGADGSYSEDPVPYVDGFQPVPRTTHNGERYTLTAQDAPYVNGNGDTVFVLHYSRYVEAKNIIVVHDYGADGSYSEDPVPYTDGFQPVPRTTHNGELYTLTKQDAPYVNGNGDTVFVLHYAKYVEQKNIIVVHDYGTDGSYSEDPVPYVDGFQPVPRTTHNGDLYTLTKQDAPYVNGNGDTVFVLHYTRYVEQKNIIVVHDYGTDGSYSEDPVPYVDGFQPVPRTTHNGERYTLTAQDAPYVNGNGDTVFVLHYTRYVEEKNIIVVHDYGTDGSYSEDPVPYVDGFQPVPQTTYGGEEYTLTAQDDPYVNGNGDIVFVLHYSKNIAPPPESSEPEPDPDPETTIRIKKTWDGEAYDGSVIFVVTRVGGSREWSREVTLRAGRSSTAVEVPSGGIYEVVELVPEGYESSIEGGVTVKISEGDIKTVDVTNTKLPEEEIPEESTPLAPPTDQDPSQAEGPSAPAEEIPDEETPVTNPPKTGAAAGSALAVLVAAAALGVVVFRKRK